VPISRPPANSVVVGLKQAYQCVSQPQMLQFRLEPGSRPPTILLLGAHCDDIEIGCAGTVMRLVREHPGARIVWVTLSSDPEREAETRNAAARLLAGATDAVVRVERFRGSYFPHEGVALKDCFESLKAYAPDCVITHCRHDLHQDHRFVNELTWNTFRNHVILEYEIPKFDGDWGVPNVFVPLTQAEVQRKCDVLMECFPSQRDRNWFTRTTFEAMARIRGIECNAAQGYAEAFYGRKVVLAPGPSALKLSQSGALLPWSKATYPTCNPYCARISTTSAAT
jgi:LmbE family N-acetylglucosaminyl deacetylase